jgi:cell division protein FtsW
MNFKAFALFFSVVLLFIVGVVMVFSTTSAEVLDGSVHQDVHYALFRQLLYAAFGFVCAMGVWFAGYKVLLKLSGFLLLLFTFLLILVLIPGVGSQINGARRWLTFFGNSFQPSEFVKYLLPMYAIQQVSALKRPMELKFFLKLVATISIPLGLILVEPDNGTVLIVGSAMIVLCLLMRVKWTYWALPLLCCMVVGGAVSLKMQHVSDRIQVFMNPELDLLGKGHQPHQAKIAAGSGQLLGRGFGESMQKMNYLPEARSDYIAAIFAEEFGFVGMSVMILLYMFIGFIGYLMAMEVRDKPAYYLITIFMFLICFQAFVNLGVVSGLLPSKGTNLPFFSQGGSSLLSNFLCISLILSAYRGTPHEKTI